MIQEKENKSTCYAEKSRKRDKNQEYIYNKEREGEGENKERKQDDYLFSIGHVKGREKWRRKPKEETEGYTCAPK